MMNCSYDVMKMNRFDELDTTVEGVADTETDEFFHTKLLLQALEELADGYQTVFIMHFFQEMKHSDIAKILNCTSETSRSQYTRAKQKIREVLSEKMELNFEEI
jgi:RNA polymerase sigma-70 factor (ECF subfamily)